MDQVTVLMEYKEQKKFECSQTSNRTINQKIGRALKKYRIALGWPIDIVARNFKLTTASYLACESGLRSKATSFAAGVSRYGSEIAFDALMLINETQREFRSSKNKTSRIITLPSTEPLPRRGGATSRRSRRTAFAQTPSFD